MWDAAINALPMRGVALLREAAGLPGTARVVQGKRYAQCQLTLNSIDNPRLVNQHPRGYRCV